VAEGKAASTSASKRILDKASLNNGKLVSPAPLAQPPKCPQCSSERTWKDGWRGSIQRYLCRSCGYRFSQLNEKINIATQISEVSNSGENHTNRRITGFDFAGKETFNSFSFEGSENIGSHNVTVIEKLLNPFCNYNRERQVCVSDREAKNLATSETRLSQAAGATTTDKMDQQGKIIELIWHLKNQGRSQSTLKNYGKYLRGILKYGANLYDEASVKEVIATRESWGTASKLMTINAYAAFCDLNGIHWHPPSYKQEKHLPFIPLESELDALISACSKKMSTLLLLLKESGMRIGEALRLRWIDLDNEHNAITLNHPEKAGEPRMFKITPRLLSMLNALTKENEYIFGHMKPWQAACNLCRLRKSVAYKLQNPRINSIHLHTFRHWYATMEYHKTKDILHVMKRLGHKRIENTLIYTELITFESDEYHSGVAANLDEAKKLIETGFEYVCTHENLMLFRKRK
jgi:integrase